MPTPITCSGRQSTQAVQTRTDLALVVGDGDFRAVLAQLLVDRTGEQLLDEGAVFQRRVGCQSGGEEAVQGGQGEAPLGRCTGEALGMQLLDKCGIAAHDAFAAVEEELYRCAHGVHKVGQERAVLQIAARANKPAGLPDAALGGHPVVSVESTLCYGTRQI